MPQSVKPGDKQQPEFIEKVIHNVHGVQKLVYFSFII